MNPTRFLILALALLTVPPVARAETGGTSAPGDHAHASPHGGQVATAGNYHIELLVHSDEVHVYLLSEKLETLPVKDVSGTIEVLASGAEARRATLRPAGEALTAPIDTSKLAKFVALVTLTIEGKAHSARFSIDTGAHRHGTAESPDDWAPPHGRHGDADASGSDPKGDDEADPRPRESRTIDGEIVDSHCYLERGTAATGPEHRDCAIRCLKQGRAPLIRETGTGLLYLAAAPSGEDLDRNLLAKHVSQQVRVTGSVIEREGLRLVEIKTIEQAHQHAAAPHGGVVGMIGERHIEMVPGPDGAVRIYLLDAFMKPLPMASVTGSARIRKKGGAARDVRLEAAPGGQYLGVTGDQAEPDDDDITVALTAGGELLTMTLPFPDPATTGNNPPAASSAHTHDGTGHH